MDYRKVSIPDTPETDIAIALPGGLVWTLRYRNYGNGGSVAILLDRVRPTYNWRNRQMHPANPLNKRDRHILRSRQIYIPIE